MKILWTDGSASPNPGPGGFAVVLEQSGGSGVPVVLGRDDDTTNIRMEGSAMIAAIKYAGEEGCEIHSDSEFWINVLTKWAPTWQTNGWKKKTGPIMNLDLVQELYGLYCKYPVKLVWVRGHVGNELNELTDEWANRARKGAKVPEV
ncbi:ribonuclease HI [Candidatus Saccharibacteria bacterium]|nr:ribonuclease HI [Candidatus Saccharibacteria bacterium]